MKQTRNRLGVLASLLEEEMTLQPLLGRIKDWELDPNRKVFKVATLSSNRNSFGLRGMILIARDGEAWEVATNDLNAKPKGTLFVVATDNENRDWSKYGFEIPRRLKPDAPAGVVKEIWG